MNNADHKAVVRARDSYKCKRCGLTNESHEQKTGRQLEVHRLIPGWNYSNHAMCVTLCRKCHSKMPRYADRLIFPGGQETGVTLVLFSQFHPRHDEFLEAIMRAVGEADDPTNVLFLGMPMKTYRKALKRQKQSQKQN